MRIENKIVNYDGRFPVKLSYFKVGRIENEWNEEIEIIIVIEGEVSININNGMYQLSEGDSVIVGQNKIHAIFGNGSYLSIKVNLFYFEKLPEQYKKCRFDSFITTTDEERDLFENMKYICSNLITHEISKTKDTIVLSTAYSYGIVYELFNVFSFLIINNETRFEDTKFINSAIEYINLNYADPELNINSLSEHFNMSPSYLSRTFKLDYDITPSAYLNNIRLQMAVHYLIDTNETIGNIASLCGFPSSRAFTNSFKEKYGEIPSVWKTKIKDEVESRPKQQIDFDSEIKLSNDYPINKFISFYANANRSENNAPSSLITTNRTIELKQSELEYASILTTSGKDIIGISAASDLLRSDVQEELRIAQKEIGFKYIKFHSLFHDDMLVYSERSGKPEYNFTFVNMVFDFILSLGLIPIVELGFMPKDLAKKPNKTTFHSQMITSLPKSNEKWAELVSKLVINFINRYGLTKVKTFKFKVWNEPASSESLFGIPIDEFLDFYEASYKAVKNISSDFQFGGPGSFMYHSLDWINTFFTETKNRGITPDFITVHYYDIVFNFNISDEYGHMKIRELSKNMRSFSNYITDVKEILKNHGLENKETFLSEWSNTTKHNDLLSDTCFKSCYAAKNTLENWGKFDHMGYWTISDFNYEMYPDNHIFHGGLGLFTAQGIKKPVYNTYYLFAKLGNRLVKKGDSYFITTDDENNIICLFYNYSHYSDIYATDIGINTSFDSRDKVFINKKKETFNLKLPEKGHYRVCLEFFNTRKGSSYDAFLSFGSGRNITPDDIEYLKEQSTPHKKVIYLNDEDSVDIFLEPFEVKLVTIRKVY